jgi:uncharacterized protein YpbB
MGRTLTTRYKDHIRNIRFNKEESAFAKHVLGKGHQYGPMEQIVEVIKYARKGNIMNIKENYSSHSSFYKIVVGIFTNFYTSKSWYLI